VELKGSRPERICGRTRLDLLSRTNVELKLSVETLESSATRLLICLVEPEGIETAVEAARRRTCPWPRLKHLVEPEGIETFGLQCHWEPSRGFRLKCLVEPEWLAAKGRAQGAKRANLWLLTLRP
jgi:hypothetical protein